MPKVLRDSGSRTQPWEEELWEVKGQVLRLSSGALQGPVGTWRPGTWTGRTAGQAKGWLAQ